MKITIGKYILDIYSEKTRDYYRNERNISEECVCDGCLNYELATDLFADEINQVFEQLGVDKKKPVEVYVNYSKNNILYYGGFYHVCGEIIQGETPWSNISKSNDTIINHLLDENMIDLTYNYKISFHEECSLLRNHFPSPCIQMEFSAYLPWVLKKENSYEI